MDKKTQKNNKKTLDIEFRMKEIRLLLPWKENL